MLGVAHHTIDFGFHGPSGIGFVVRAAGRPTERMAVETLRRHIGIGKGRRQPVSRLQTMRLMTRRAALRVGKIHMLVR